MNEFVSPSADQAVAGTDAGGVGSRLRAAREAARMSRAEVAQALKFSTRQIEALETDNYGALPGTTIVRGFVRNYARLLKLDADDLLRRLDPVQPSMPAEIRPPANMGIATLSRGMRELSFWATAAIVLLLAAAMLVLWNFFGPAPAPRPEATIAMPLSPPEAPVLQVPGQAGSGSATPAEDVMPPQAALPHHSAAPTLRFGFAGSSWVEVTDANRQLLHSGEQPGGSELTLSGKPPFAIVVGNAGNVTLTYGEKSVDLAPHTRANVARLTLE